MSAPQPTRGPCRVIGGEKLPAEAGGADAICAAVQRAVAARAPGVRYSAEVRVLSRPDADYGRALREGFLAAAGETVVMFDVDYYDLDFLDRALALVGQPGGPSVVVGSKRATGAVDTRSAGRRLVTSIFSQVLRLGFGLFPNPLRQVSDRQCQRRERLSGRSRQADRRRSLARSRNSIGLEYAAHRFWKGAQRTGRQHRGAALEFQSG